MPTAQTKKKKPAKGSAPPKGAAGSSKRAGTKKGAAPKKAAAAKKTRPAKKEAAPKKAKGIRRAKPPKSKAAAKVFLLKLFEAEKWTDVVHVTYELTKLANVRGTKPAQVAADVDSLTGWTAGQRVLAAKVVSALKRDGDFVSDLTAALTTASTRKFGKPDAKVRESIEQKAKEQFTGA